MCLEAVEGSRRGPSDVSLTAAFGGRILHMPERTPPTDSLPPLLLPLVRKPMGVALDTQTLYTDTRRGDDTVIVEVKRPAKRRE